MPAHGDTGMYMGSPIEGMRQHRQIKVGRSGVRGMQWHIACRQSGLSLLEIMIALVVMSLGMLGLAGLQLTGLQNNRDAYNNAIAGQAVQDVTERLNVDWDAAANKMTRNAITGNTVRTINGNAASCANDVAFTFDNRVACIASALPTATVMIRELTASPKTYYVAVVWSDPQATVNGWSGGDATTACGGDASIGTRCYYTVYMP